MQMEFFGRTGVRVSRLSFGTMSFGGDADEAMSAKLYARAKDAGINTFDCADVYAGGKSEQILGRLIATHRDEVVITTKAYFPTGPDANARGSSRYHLVRAVEASLKRLATDRIDFFFLHRFDDATPVDETLRALEDLVRQGKILYVAASNFAAWQVMKAIGVAQREHLSPICGIQPMYNLAKRQAEVELLPMCQSEGLGVMTYSPLGGGLLSGKYGRSRRPDSGRLTSNPMYQTRYGDPAYYETAERFTELARLHGISPATLAVSWVAHHPSVTTVLVGARNLEQLEPLLDAANLPLSDVLYREISALTPTPPPATDRNEETSSHNYGSR